MIAERISAPRVWPAAECRQGPLSFAAATDAFRRRYRPRNVGLRSSSSVATIATKTPAIPTALMNPILPRTYRSIGGEPKIHTSVHGGAGGRMFFWLSLP